MRRLSMYIGRQRRAVIIYWSSRQLGCDTPHPRVDVTKIFYNNVHNNIMKMLWFIFFLTELQIDLQIVIITSNIGFNISDKEKKTGKQINFPKKFGNYSGYRNVLEYLELTWEKIKGLITKNKPLF